MREAHRLNHGTTRLTESSAWSARLAARALLISLACSIALAAVLPAQSDRPKPKRTEPEIKAQFLTHLAMLTTWSEEALPRGEDKELVIGILGEHAFQADHLKLIQSQRNETSARKVVVKALTTSADAANCQIVFMAKGSKDDLVREVEKLTAGKPILTILDREGQGAIVEMYAQTTVKLRIDDAEARRRGLRISSRILNIAEKRE